MEQSLQARLVGIDSSPVDARDLTVLVDADESSWSSWNRFAEQFAADTGAQTVRVDDGGVTGTTFFDHVRRLRRPVLNNPKGQNDVTPPDLTRRPVRNPIPLWTWSLVWRRDDPNPLVHAVADALTAGVDASCLTAPGTWLPAGDPHRAVAG